MKFKFEQEHEKQLISEEKPQSIQKKKSISSRQESREIKYYLTSAVTMFKNQINQELKVQQILKNQIQTLNNQDLQADLVASNQSLINHSEPNLPKVQLLNAESMPQFQNINSLIHSNNSLKDNQLLNIQSQVFRSQNKIQIDSISRSIKVQTNHQKTQKLRSIKCELMTKGYPITKKQQINDTVPLNKNKLPHRFNLKI